MPERYRRDRYDFAGSSSMRYLAVDRGPNTEKKGHPMGYQHQAEPQKPLRNPKTSPAVDTSHTSAGPANAELNRALRHAAAHEYQKALGLLHNAGTSSAVRNALGVCLLRLGNAEEAVRVFRQLVLKSGCTWMRSELPTLYKTNFATALLVGGYIHGCVDVLAEIREDSHPAVQKLRSAVSRWEKSLSVWQMLKWRIGGMQPAHARVELDFEPGHFEAA